MVQSKINEKNIRSYNVHRDDTYNVSAENPDHIPFSQPLVAKFNFIDLFAGIGGFRLAMRELGGRCVFSSEWDLSCQKTYYANFGETPVGDIQKIDEGDIPDHDILLAGFPCQAFSVAGRKAGFSDTRGTLFFDVARIISKKRPRAFILENVKGLAIHDKGRTLSTILSVLRNDLGYNVPAPKVINAVDFGVPQNRERIFIVGFRDSPSEGFDYPTGEKKRAKIADILEKRPVDIRYYLSQRYMNTLKNHRKRHEYKGNGFGYLILENKSIASAIVIGGMGKERNLVADHRITDMTLYEKSDKNSEFVRMMTPREWARLQGFPEEFRIVVSNTQAYKQFANSVAVPAVAAIGAKVVDILSKS